MKKTILAAAFLLALPVYARAQTATVCDGPICLDWWDESNDSGDPYRIGQGWLVSRNTRTGDYYEGWYYFDLTTGYVGSRWESAYRGDPHWIGIEAPIDDRIWGNVRCDDMQGQNDRFRDNLIQITRESIQRGVESAIASIWTKFAWQLALANASGHMIYGISYDFFGYFGRCYLR